MTDNARPLGLSAALVVHRSIVTCPECGTDATLTTDGIHAYAETGIVPSDRTTGWEATTLVRIDRRVLVQCRNEHVAFPGCDGILTFDLSMSDSWGPHTEASRLLLAGGVTLRRE